LHRAQESLRTIEEILRGFDPKAAARIAELRFECYDVEKEYYATAARIDKRRLLEFSLYVVTGREQSKGRDDSEVVRRAIEGGAGAIQFRAKEPDAGELLRTAKELRTITADAGVTFIVNDHVDVALASGADGVHLGQEDLPVQEARKIAGPDLIIGLSIHSLEQAVEGEASGADYVNVGPVFATQTKAHGGPPVGPELITRVKARVGIPITCMGGINGDNVEQVVKAGADRVAVVSAVVGADDIALAAGDLVERVRRARAKRARSEDCRTGE
jgi:thiamine-phosphate pyrophosphorylase